MSERHDPVVTRDDLDRGFAHLGLVGVPIVVVHASLSAFGRVADGASTVVAALRAAAATVVMPTFTGACQLPTPPGHGLPNNADDHRASDWPEFRRDLATTPPYRAEASPSAEFGAVAMALLREPDALRSNTPLSSFAAVGPRARELVNQGTPNHPLQVLQAAAAEGAWIVLLGVAHTVNTTIHVAEHLEHRGRFTRFARVDERPDGWITVHNLGGYSDSFGAIEPHLRSFTREVNIGAARSRAVSAGRVIEVARRLIRADPVALTDPAATDTRGAAAVAQRLEYLTQLAEH